MNVVRLLLCVGVSAGFVLLGACGKSEDVPPRYNQRLGDGPEGAPLGTPSVDLGILQDQSSYQPANFTSLPGVAGSAATADSDEQAAVRQRMGEFLDGLVEFDFDTMLEAFNPEQVAPLKEHVSAMYEVVDKVKVLQRSAQEKMSAQLGMDVEALQASNELFWTYVEKVAAALPDTLVVDVDQENASVGVDGEKFATSMETLAKDFMAELSELDPAGADVIRQTFEQAQTMAKQAVAAKAAEYGVDLEADEGAEAGIGVPEIPVTVPLAKIDGEWRIQLPFTFTEEQAELVGEALVLAQDFLDKLTDKVEGVDTLDQQALMMMGQQTFLEVMPQAMGLFARAQQVFGPAMESVAEPGEPGADEGRDEAGEEEEEAEDEPQPPMIP